MASEWREMRKQQNQEMKNPQWHKLRNKHRQEIKQAYKAEKANLEAPASQILQDALQQLENLPAKADSPKISPALPDELPAEVEAKLDDLFEFKEDAVVYPLDTIIKWVRASGWDIEKLREYVLSENEFLKKEPFYREKLEAKDDDLKRMAIRVNIRDLRAEREAVVVTYLVKVFGCEKEAAVKAWEASSNGLEEAERALEVMGFTRRVK